ncbi:toprim domain-containing protein [Terasakiella sp. SH-1]|uniref:toprim domain-containing protein n=1 Tax=Terasakiella sp. SH-1 TaxID=2560057 RepID=UPI001431F12C|nr:toprim domain-containing protein [Terasakiella sp. SH-1]
MVLVEGAFDVAKCVEVDIKNILATFGARLYEAQVAKLKALGIKRALLFYDRDKAGFEGSGQAAELLAEQGIEADIFDWSQEFQNSVGETRPIPESITDPCEFSVEQLKWLRAKGVV